MAPPRPSTGRSTRRPAGARGHAGAWPTRVAKALSHTARISVLQALGEGQTSPSDVAAAGSLSVGVVAYHVRELKSAGFVRAVSTQRVRGAVEHFYELTEDGRAAVKALEAVLRHDPQQRSRGARRKRSTSATSPRASASR